MRAEAARPLRAALPAFSTLATKALALAEQRTVVELLLTEQRDGGSEWVSLSARNAPYSALPQTHRRTHPDAVTARPTGG
jgi:hypothetical protein